MWAGHLRSEVPSLIFQPCIHRRSSILCTCSRATLQTGTFAEGKLTGLRSRQQSQFPMKSCQERRPICAPADQITNICSEKTSVRGSQDMCENRHVHKIHPPSNPRQFATRYPIIVANTGKLCMIAVVLRSWRGWWMRTPSSGDRPGTWYLREPDPSPLAVRSPTVARPGIFPSFTGELH